MQPASVKKDKALYHKDSIRETLIYGPFTLNPANGTHNKGFFKLDPNSDIVNARLKGLCEGCMVLSAKSDIVHADGSKLDIGGDNVYSHHVIMTVMGRSMAPINVVPGMCPDGKMGGFNFGDILGGSGMSHGSMGGGHADKPAAHGGMSMKQKIKRQLAGFQLPKGIDLNMITKFIKFSVFMGQGEDSSGLVFTDPTDTIKSGFYLGKGDDMNMMAELINYNEAKKDVYVTLDYEYIPDMKTRPADYLQVGMNAINVDPCGVQKLYPPTDKAMRYASPPWNVISDGYLLDVKPHMHDGGINMTFYRNGEAACTSKAVYGDEGQATLVNGQAWQTIQSYTPCEKPVEVKKGDKLTMEAWYVQSVPLYAYQYTKLITGMT